jgi:tRNA threonylcarbamoyladenosine modification (KEOPS) complex  Pcc1 subunit
MKARASIRFKLQSLKQRDTLFAALLPEMKTASVRSRATLQKEGAFLVLRVEANDTVALRSALNAYLRWISSIIDVLQTL